jgi:hypothetical protein
MAAKAPLSRLRSRLDLATCRKKLANPLYQAVLPGRELVGRRFADVVPELGQEVWDVFRRVMDTGEPYVANEWHMPYDSDQDGVLEDHWFNVVYHPYREKDGSVSGFIAVLTNVTVQVLARKELERVNKELEEFTYIASHDLQEPLRMVNVYSQLLVKRFGSGNKNAEQYAAFVQQGVTRMEILIRDLLTYSRTVQRDERVVGTADLSLALSEAQSVLQHRIEETRAVIHAQPLPEVRGDTQQLTHVFQNLLSNALKYRKKSFHPKFISRQSESGSTGRSLSETAVSASSRSTPRRSSAYSSVFTRTSIPVLDWVWQSASASSNDTGDTCGPMAGQVKVRRFISLCQGTKDNEITEHPSCRGQSG